MFKNLIFVLVGATIIPPLTWAQEGVMVGSLGSPPGIQWGGVDTPKPPTTAGTTTTTTRPSTTTTTTTKPPSTTTTTPKPSTSTTTTTPKPSSTTTTTSTPKPSSTTTPPVGDCRWVSRGDGYGDPCMRQFGDYTWRFCGSCGADGMCPCCRDLGGCPSTTTRYSQ